MTSGAWTDSSLPTYGWEGGKQWSGADGRYLSVFGLEKWNVYQMTRQFERIIGHKINGSYCNAEYYIGNVGPYYANLTSSYRAWCDQSSSAYWTNAQGKQVFDSIWTSNDELRLLARLMQQIRGHSFDAGVSLAEVDKFANTTLGLIQNLGYGVLDLCRGNFARFARRFGTAPPSRTRVRRLRLLDVPGRFLEMQYAWMPVFNDVFEASVAFENLSKGPRKHTYKASLKVRKTVADSSYIKFPPRKLEARRKYTFQAYEEMSAFRQLGLTNPATVVWERVPWSFVVDWFMPIGSYLALIGEVPHLRGRFLQTSSVTQKVSGTPTGAAATGATVNRSVFSGHIESTNFWINRVPLGSPPEVPLPRLQVAGAVQGARIYNAIALLSQIVGRVTSLSGRGRSPGSIADDQQIRSWSNSIWAIR